jgi:pyruvate/2-oxoglutarate dehydrogenase complex dihydrolipoamide dehydrogenase (E3) component
MPQIYHNWTSRAVLFLQAGLEIDAGLREELDSRGIDVYRGRITAVEHVDGEVQAARLDSGQRVEVDTLWWRPDGEPQPLTRKIIQDFTLELEENGFIKTDAQFQTSAGGLWAVGDVLGWVGALAAAYQASHAAIAISRTRDE